jgi:hypothetical protein
MVLEDGYDDGGSDFIHDSGRVIVRTNTLATAYANLQPSTRNHASHRKLTTSTSEQRNVRRSHHKTTQHEIFNRKACTTKQPRVPTPQLPSTRTKQRRQLATRSHEEHHCQALRARHSPPNHDDYDNGED